MENISLWETISKRQTTYSPLLNNIEVDVAIIGGGMTGLTAAAQLIAQGKKVAIVEGDRIGGVTTGHSTGNLYIPVQPFYQTICAKFDFETAKSIAYSRKFAIDYIEKTIQEKQISCHFSRRPWYGYTVDHERISLNKEIELFKKMEIPIAYCNELPLSFHFTKAIVMSHQARFNPLQYVISLAQDLVKQGCLIFEKTRVSKIEEKNICFLHTEKAILKANKVIMATHTPIGISLTHMFTAPYRSYVIAARLTDPLPEGHFWNLDNRPFSTSTHAIFNNDQPDILMVAGSHHKVGQTKNALKHYKEIETFINKHFSVTDIVGRWSAQHYQSADSIPYIGFANRTTKRIYMATGYFADGLIYGTLAGLIISDLILSEKNPLIDIYKRKRFNLFSSLPFLTKENVNVFMQYLKDYPSFSTGKYDDIKKGEGKICEINQEKLAVSRDENNKLHIVSAVCTHMKCIVNWNNAEKTWDCPCHGSRFKPDGEVIEGPATLNLKKSTEEIGV